MGCLKSLFISFFFLILTSLSANAQRDSTVMLSFNAQLDSVASIDSALSNFHHKFPLPNLLEYSILGNLALPSYANIFDSKSLFGFRLMNNVYTPFEYNHHDIIINSCLKPHTDLYIGFGSMKESTFGFEHAQNFGKYLNLTSSLRTSRTEAFYKNQTPNFINFRAAFAFTAPNRKFTSRAEVVTNRIVHKENAGVDTASIYVDNVKSNTEVLSTNMANALMKKNTNSVSLLSYFHLNPTDSIADTSNVLSGLGHAHFFHTASFAEEWYRYTDTLEFFTPKIDSSFDKLGIKDFTYHHSIQNSIGFLLNNKSNRGLNFLKVVAEHQYHYVHQTAMKNYFNNVHLALDLRYKIKAFDLYAQTEGFTNGFNAGDYRLNMGMSRSIKILNNKFVADISILHQKAQPNYQSIYASSIKFHWNNLSFQKVGVSQASLKLSGAETVLEVNMFQISNYIYINQQFNAQQSSIDQNLFQVWAKHKFEIGKFNLVPKVLYQKVNNDSDFLRLPSLGMNLQAYFEGYLFKHATFSQAGVELNYIKGFYGNAYMPLLNQFYLQDKVLVAQYPQLDIFFNFKIQSVRVFFKIANVTDGIYPTKVYINVPGNPMYGRVFRLGLIWRFWN